MSPARQWCRRQLTAPCLANHCCLEGETGPRYFTPTIKKSLSFDDDVNTFQHVVECSMTHPHMTSDRASGELTNQVHFEGHTVWVGTARAGRTLPHAALNGRPNLGPEAA